MVGCGETPTNWNWVSDPSDPNNVKIEKEIRIILQKPTGELTKADLEKVTKLQHLNNNQLTDVKSLEKLTRLEFLTLRHNPDLTTSQIVELRKALPKCLIYSNPKKLVSDPIVEKAIRGRLRKPTGLLTKADLEVLERLNLHSNQLTSVKGLENLTQLTHLHLNNNQLTDVKGLEKLTQLTELHLEDNPDLTKAQIDELKKALPKCDIQPYTKK